jgi:hypothetical protein
MLPQLASMFTVPYFFPPTSTGQAQLGSPLLSLETFRSSEIPVRYYTLLQQFRAFRSRWELGNDPAPFQVAFLEPVLLSQ